MIQVSDSTRPVTGTLGSGHCCPRCSAPEPSVPVAQVGNDTEVCYVYECPRCRHSWWNTYNTTADEPWVVAA